METAVVTWMLLNWYSKYPCALPSKSSNASCALFVWLLWVSEGCLTEFTIPKTNSCVSNPEGAQVPKKEHTRYSKNQDKLRGGVETAVVMWVWVTQNNSCVLPSTSSSLIVLYCCEFRPVVARFRAPCVTRVHTPQNKPFVLLTQRAYSAECKQSWRVKKTHSNKLMVYQ